MQRIVLKLFGATPHPSYQDLGIRSTEGGDERTLVFAGYPDRPVTAKKAIEMARQAATLDGSGYGKLVILGWDYDGATFRSRWQAFRGNGKNLNTVPKNASTPLTKGKEYRAMVRVVDVFGNDASAETSINLPGEK